MKKQEFKALLKDAGLTKKTFSKLSDTSYDTIMGWTKKEKSQIPGWVDSWIRYYKSHKEHVALKKMFKE
ncbi:MAG: hypothetical protein KU37_02365 [Sulfuricurvum sp. PC08-66]|nr:MAG: hypothetical protein KU37_02365 [Sulfuricurvum sp. PC08-66]